MALLPMYPGQAFSPQTALALTCGASDTSITVDNGDALPDPPNYLTLGTHGDADAETVLYTVRSGNIISGLTRGIEGAAAAHDAGTIIGSYITAVEWNKHKTNIEALDSGKENAGAVAAHNSSGSAHSAEFSAKQSKITSSGILKGDGSGGVSAAVAGTDYIATESDPTVPAWAKSETKPSYTAAEVGADASGTATGAVSAHNTNASAHSTAMAAKQDKITISGILKGNGATVSAATPGTDFEAAGAASTAVAAHNTNASAHSEQFDAKAPILLPSATVSASETLGLARGGKLLLCNASAAMTLTVPTNASVAHPVGTQITLSQVGAGAVTLAAASGVTINSKDGKLAIDGQYGAVTLVKTNTNTWYLWGALS